MIAAGEFGLEGFVGIKVEASDAPPAGFQLRDQVGQLAVTRRAAHEADPRSAFKYFFAFLLRQTAQDTDNLSIG